MVEAAVFACAPHTPKGSLAHGAPQMLSLARCPDDDDEDDDDDD